MFLEAQFGSDNVSPIARPKLPSNLLTGASSPTALVDGNPTDGGDRTDEELSEAERQEIERLHSVGIPVPGVEIRVDKMVAKVWLEELEVECANRTLEARVRAVVERACDVIAPLWG